MVVLACLSQHEGHHVVWLSSNTTQDFLRQAVRRYCAGADTATFAATILSYSTADAKSHIRAYFKPDCIGLRYRDIGQQSAVATRQGIFSLLVISWPSTYIAKLTQVSCDVDSRCGECNVRFAAIATMAAVCFRKLRSVSSLAISVYKK
jgi:hypothetical protein